MDRLFLDSNVLISAAWRPQSRMRRLWRLEGVELLTSRFAVIEAHRNLETEEQLRDLELLLQSTIVGEDGVEPGADEVSALLPEKNQPILNGAIALGATHLVTGDKRHFRLLYGRVILGVRIEQPSDCLLRHGISP
jgi:predicted nucleic acid-binding protein